MALNNYSAELEICEGETQRFDIMEMIGYNLDLSPLIWKIYFPDGTEVPADSYITKVDGDTIEIDLSSMPDFNGEIPFYIVAYDSTQVVFDINVTTTVFPVNDAPEGADANASLQEDGSYAFAVDDFGFSDPADGDAFQAVVVSSVPANGQLLLNGVAVAAGETVSVADIEAGNFVFVPDAGYNGVTGFDFQVQDDGGVDPNCGGVDTDPTPNSFTLTVTPVDDVPVAVDDFYTTDVGVVVSASLANNDTPSEDGGNVWSLVSGPANGTVTVNPDGTFSYQPNSGYVGTDTFEYQIVDIDGSVATATATVTIEGLQTAIVGDKVWVDDNADGLQDGTEAGVAGVEVTLHGAGADGVFGSADDTTETTTTNADGFYYFEGVVGQEYYITVEAPANYEFTLQDVDLNAFDDIDSDVDDMGVSGTFVVSGVEDNLHTDVGLVRVNDVPVAADDAYTTDEDVPVSGDLSGNDTPSADGGNVWALVSGPSNGTVVVNADGTFTYTPNPDYNGTDSFEYSITDIDGDTTTATATITIDPVNDVPVAADDAYTTDEDVPVSGDLSGNDTPSADGGNVWALVSGPSNGTVVVNADGTFTYTPNPDYNGTDSFEYSITDIDGDTTTATATITIDPVNDVPVAVDDNYTVDEDAVLNGDLSGNDTPSTDGGNVWSLVSGPSNGTVTVNPDGTFTYTPNADYNGPDSFEYKIVDADGDETTATATITVDPTNDVPVAADDAYTTDEDVPVSGDLSGNDTPSADGGNVWALVSGPSNGTVVVNADGTFTYTPNPDYNGTDSFEYSITDIDGDTTTATATITIDPVNDVPVAVDDNYTVDEDAVLNGDLSGNDTPSTDGGNVWSLVSGPSNGTVTVNPDGTFTYTPNADYNGPDSFEYKIVDADGDETTATATITVAPTNDVPVAADDAYTTDEDVPVSGDLTGNDTPSADGGNVWALVSGPSNGTVVVNADGTFTYTPNPDYNGTDSFEYSITDIDGDTTTATATITIDPANDVPLAMDDAYTTDEDVPVSGDLSGNDTPSADGGNVWALVSGPSNGTVVVNADGTFTYTPNPDYNGTDSFEYSITDIDGDTTTATATITIDPVNDVPVAADDAYTTDEDVPVSGDLSGNDTPSADGGNVWALVSGPSNGTVVVNADGTFTYTPNPDYNGTDSFEYSITDIDGDTTTATATITIDPVNDVPVAVDDNYTVDEDAVLNGDLSGNDTPSTDGGNVWSLVSGPGNGTVTVNPDGTFTYTPNADYNGPDSFEYKIVDANGDETTATATITVAPTNDVPVAADDALSTDYGVPVAGDLAGNDTPSADGGNVWSKVTDPSNGTVVVNADGTFTYTPDDGFYGSDTFTYQIVDANGDISEATATITVGEPPANASLGDRVWLDANEDGVQGADEVGVEGVTVTLTGAGADGVFGTADDVTATDVTDANGNYLFENLTAGQQYEVTVDQPTGYEFTVQDSGADDSADSDVNADGVSQVVTLGVGENNLDLDAGLTECKVDLGDTIWNDANGNGIQDSGEAGVAGVELTLVGAGADGQFGTADDTSSTTTTDANGNYLFENVVWGDYKIQMTVPDGYELTTANIGGDDSKDSDFLFFSSKSTTNLIVNGSFEDPNCDWGMYESVTGWTGLGDKIEIGRAHHFGVTGATGQNVLELDANNTCVDGNGVYQDVQTSNGQQYELSLDVAARDCTNLATNVVDVYWAGEKVATISPTSTELTTYTFVVEGTGGLDRLELREAVGTNDSVGGIIDNVSLYAFDSVVETGVISVNSCADDLTIDGGLVEGNTCIMTCEDKSVTFTVDLEDGQTIMEFTQTAHGTIVDNGDGSFTYTPATNYNGNDGFSYTIGTVEYVDSTESVYICNSSFEDKCLSNGYSSSSIPGWSTGNTWWSTDSKTWNPGRYEEGIVSDGYNVASVGTKGISQTLAEKFVEGVKYELKVDVGNLGSTSKDDNSALVKVYAGNTLIACLTASDLGGVSKDGFKTATLSFEGTGFTSRDCVYGEKLTIVLDSTCVTYYDNVRLTKTTTTATTVAGETVDVCIDVKPVNDAPEGADKTVTVDDTRVYTVGVDDFGFSDIDGDNFASVIIDTLPGAGSLTLDGAAVSAGQTISVADIEAGKLVFTGSGSTDAAITFRVQDDGGVDVNCGGTDTDATANTLCFDLPESLGQVGDRVWIDADCDGIQDAGEAGAAGVTVKLLDGSGCVVASTTTDADGYYLFDNVRAGTYQVKVIQPDGYKVTTKDASGSTWENDSDANAYGVTDCFTVGEGQVINSIDVGLCATKACVGNRVWEDANHNSIQDAGELGIGGIKVTLYGWNGYCDYKVATTYTDANGNYKFDGVNEGWYYVAFDKSNVWHQASWGNWANMSNWNWGYKDVGSDDSKDSDVNRCDGDYTTTDWTWINAGACNLSLDAAITPIVIDLDGDGVETVARDAAGGTFDLFGNGQAIASGWVGADDGMLAIDLNGNGMIDDISELFGGSQKGDGFAKLASFDSNGDGVVDANDADFAKLSIWQDANGNHATDAGELLSLTEAGVASLQVAYEELPFMDAQGNLHLERSSATMADGSTVDMTDVYFNVAQADADAAGVDLSSMADLLDMGGSLDALLGSSDPLDAFPGSFDSASADIAAMTQLADLYEQAAA
ncbi:Ig-like domain-containing protein [Nitrogeniibacter aestuarii]|uniref:Ig-like domain-containing protein n=1 Tax=Nitrogeniibacter aestuarii TaxID=2815343 RepID=UPI001E437DE8|nr:Ig-like domain-containing protein [Nitrogeniibacter aestuarii]